MRGKWLWVIYPLMVLIVIRTAVSAFRVPWTWTQDQLLLVLLALAIAFGVGQWLLIWRRGGAAAVKAQWAVRQERMDAAFTTKAVTRNFLIWLLIGVALVVLFNFAKH
ncbi:MAG TPA: hypothetical protein VGM26_06135 [Rhizomicrobium sp.]|jgi:hypothetical protein